MGNQRLREAAEQTARALRGHLGGPDDDHYAVLDIQPIEVVEAWSKTWPAGIAYHLSEALYMMARLHTKRQPIRDLKKARWLLDRAIGKLEAVQSEQAGYGARDRDAD